MDFTVKRYSQLLHSLLSQGFSFLPVATYLRLFPNSQSEISNHQSPIRNPPSEFRLPPSAIRLPQSEIPPCSMPQAPCPMPQAPCPPPPAFVLLRHDVDARPQNALRMARLEHSLGIRGTYYFRMPHTFDPPIIKEIAALGHETGYHYETMVQIKIGRGQGRGQGREEHVKWAYELFVENLEKLRTIVPVTTICMHGSPLSRFDNREIWEKYDYRNLDILGDPYFDIDFSRVAYFTDTGRRWDGTGVSIRDKVVPGIRDVETEGRGGFRKAEGGLRNSDFGVRNETKSVDRRFPVYHSTFEMIKAIENGTFPRQAMLTVHPQRWNERLIPWTKELVWQNVKNAGKRALIKIRG